MLPQRLLGVRGARGGLDQPPHTGGCLTTDFPDHVCLKEVDIFRRTICSGVCFLPFISDLLAPYGQFGPHITWASQRGPHNALRRVRVACRPIIDRRRGEVCALGRGPSRVHAPGKGLSRLSEFR